jgi:excisionase family DNA binding protein
MSPENMVRSPVDSSQEFLTAQEVSERLRLPLSTVYYLAKSGDLPAVHLGRSWRFPCAAVAALGERNFKSARVLVVDDDAVTRALVLGVLESRGHVLVEAVDAESGMAEARRQRFDLLLIDFKLPGKDGAQLIQELRGEYSLGQMIMITAFADLMDSDKILELGAVTLLRKPLDPAQLIECVERSLAPSRPGPGWPKKVLGTTGVHSVKNAEPETTLSVRERDTNIQ